MRELIVDNFAGGGGASTGIELALGRSPDIAINHDPQALAMHEANHPHTRHFAEDVFAVRPREITGGAPVALAWFSPDCTYHSNANGGRPVARGRRGLAGVALKWAHQVRPAIIIVENVRQFQDWGPLLPNSRPDPRMRGRHFERWRSRFLAMGYHLDARLLNAAEYGTPTSRERLFVVARRDGAPIEWPAPTVVRRSAREALDLSLPTGPVDRPGRAAATLAKIARGRERFGCEPFILSYYGNAGYRGLDEPLPTVTTHDRFALIHGDRMRMLAARELANAQGFPADYRLPARHADAVRFIGNSVCPPLAEAIVRANLPELIVRRQREQQAA